MADVPLPRWRYWVTIVALQWFRPIFPTVAALLVVSTLIASSAGGLAAGERSTHGPTSVGPWDPLIGDPGTTVPRYHVSTAHLAPAPGPASRPAQYPSLGAWVAYDPVDASFWSTTAGNSVAVIPANSTYTVSATVPVGSDPFDVAVDAGSNQVFVTNQLSDNVTVINGSSLFAIASIPVGVLPAGVAVAPADGYAFVANEGSNNVSMISLTTLSVVRSIAVGQGPVGVTFDAATDEVYVANGASYSVTAIDGSTGAVLGSVSVGAGPVGVAVDDRSDTVWVTNALSQNISVINATTLTTVASVPVLNPGWGSIELSDLVYDDATDQLWVGAGYVYLIVLNATAMNVSYIYTTDPSGAAYDPSTGQVCLTNTYNSTFECFTSAGPYASVTPITFTESGLSAGAEWSVAEVDGPALWTNASTLTFYVGPDWLFATWHYYYSFYVAPTASAAAGSASLQVNASTRAISVNVTFAASTSVGWVQFNETGLPSGSGWNVLLAGLLLEGAGTSLGSWATSGTYPFTVASVADGAPTPAAGNLAAAGAATFQSIAFAPEVWPVSFVQAGLPAGAAWSVTFTSSPTGTLPSGSGSQTGTTWSTNLTNGSYDFSVATADPAYGAAGNGSLTVIGASTPAVVIDFLPLDFPFQVTESGLPAGTSWTLNVSGSVAATSASTLILHLPAGTYSFTVGPVSGFRAAPPNGTLEVLPAGPNALSLNFTSTSVFNVTFQESGLPAGTGWSVAIGSAFESGLAASITFVEPNGSYGYVVLAVTGYVATPSGVVSVSGHDVVVDVRFSPQTFPVIVVEYGLPNGTNWSVTVTDPTTGYNATHASDTSAIIFELPNGTYSVEVSLPAGYSANVTGGQFTVDGAGINGPAVHYAPSGTTSPGPAAPSSGVPFWYWIVLGALALVIVLLGLGWWTTRRRPPPARDGPRPT